MKNLHNFITMFLLICLVLLISPPVIWSEEEYKVTFEQFEQAKAFFDDSSPVLKKLNWKKILPPKDYDKLTYDVDAMKEGWAEQVGFKAPDVVSKIAPEITPGKYTYKDKEKYPGLKELIWPTMYNRFKPGGPPHCGNFPEMEVVPTRQYYYSLPVIKATKRHLGQPKLDDKGYLIEETYMGGVPFPRPEGKFKAQQIVYNWVKNYRNPESLYFIAWLKGFTKELREDHNCKFITWNLRLHSRVTISPFGWYDKRAEKRHEARGFLSYLLSPRDLYGNVINLTMFQEWDDYDQYLIYISQLRRVRKVSGTDTQDIAIGSDAIYEDSDMWSQKITPFRNPYKYKLTAEGEYLVPAYSVDGSEYLSKKGLEWHNLKFERRPCYVLELTQLDKSYVYGKRILYIDRETFNILEIVNYDQKGHLYRTLFSINAWYPESGSYLMFQTFQTDHLDLHSTWGRFLGHPATWLRREHISMRHLIKKGK